MYLKIKHCSYRLITDILIWSQVGSASVRGVGPVGDTQVWM